MLSFAVVLIPILILGPLAICLGILKYFFPHHTLKINPTFLVPLAIPFFLLTNMDAIFQLRNFLPNFCCENKDAVEFFVSHFWVDNYQEFQKNIDVILGFYLRPAAWTAIFAYLARRGIESVLIKEHSLPKGDSPNENNKKRLNSELVLRVLISAIDSIYYVIGKLTISILLSDMARAATSTKQAVVMCDVSTDDGYLYCGKFVQYFFDQDSKLDGISISNGIRYRSEEDFNSSSVKVISYLLPNQGEVHFPAGKIQNFHFWRIHKGHTFTFKLNAAHHPARIAWALSLQWALPLMKISVVVKQKSTTKVLFDEFTKNMLKIRLNRKQVKLTTVDEP